jgi:large subunit ribosomal protein L13
MKTYSAKPETVEHKWLLVDATDKVLGRLCSRLAAILRGKHKPEYTPHVDVGDYVVIVNAEKIRVTGDKAKGKVYYSHSEYPGGLKTITFEKLMQKNPIRAIELAIKGMLPKGPLGREMFRKLKVYAGNEHPHTAQQPTVIEVE